MHKTCYLSKRLIYWDISACTLTDNAHNRANFGKTWAKLCLGRGCGEISPAQAEFAVQRGQAPYGGLLTPDEVQAVNDLTSSIKIPGAKGGKLPLFLP